MIMFNLSKGLLVLSVFCVISAGVTEESSEKQCTAISGNNGENINGSHSEVDNFEGDLKSDVLTDAETIDFQNETTNVEVENDDYFSINERGIVEGGVDNPTTSIMEDVLVTETVGNINSSHGEFSEDVSILWNDEEITHQNSTVTKGFTESETNQIISTPESMTFEVQVDDFMKSRVAYHNAIVGDLNQTESNSSITLDSDEVDSSKEKFGTPEKLTMEETMGDVWRENPNKNIHGSQPQNKKTDPELNLDNHEFYDKPESYKLVMTKKDKQMEFKKEEPTTVKYDVQYTTESSLTTDTTVEPTRIIIEQNTFDSINRFEESTTNVFVSESTGHKITVENSTDTESEIKAEKQCVSTSKSASDGVPENDPVAEKLYAYGTKDDNEEKIANNTLDYHSERNSRKFTSQSLRDYKDISEEDLIEIQNLLPDHPSFKKEKIEPGVLFEECVDCDFRILPIRPSQQRDSPKFEDEPLPTHTIRFSDLPEGRELQIYSLGVSDGFFLFGYLSEFLSWIQPNEFPVKLLRDALRSQITWINLITQSLQVEAGFVACLVVGVLLALAVPVIMLSHACYRMTSREDDDTDDKVGWAGNCRRRTLVFILQILLVLLLAGMVAMFVTNEQLSEAVVKSSDVIQTSLSDVSTFVHNSHLQLHFLVTQSLDQALQAVYADLDNVDSLLGRPIQRELIRETGIDVALESLADLTKEAKETTQQVDRLLDEVRVVQEMVVSTRDKLSDLRQQVELFRRACGPRDRALCDAIDASGLDVTLRLDRLKSDERLHRMRRMGGVGLEAAATEAKERFMSVPARVDTDTRDAREAARRQLMRQRADVDERSLALERLVRETTSKVNEAKYQAGFWMQDLDQFEYWRWIVCMGGGVAVMMVWTLLLCSLCCGCCGSEKAAGPTILVTIVLVCLLSTVLWSIALVGMLFGGHGEVFVCRPLFDEPDYHVISRLVDQPGVFYSEPRGGFIANVLYGNDTLDVPIRHVLKECRENHGVYPTLGLGRVFDMEAAVDQHRWSASTTQLRSVRANLSSLQVLSPALHDQLTDLLSTLSVNFTEHRIEMSRPVTGKDMDSFARQLDNIGNQMRDLAVASRMETLSSRTRRLIDSHIRPLEGRKDALVYQLTALEVQTGPLQRQVNQSLSHLKTIQFFINSQGEAIAQQKSRQYVDRLLSYVDQLRRHVVDAVSSNVAPCRPLWDIFNTTRLFLCRHTMDPLNGYWFAAMWCLVVLLVATPVCLKLVDYYRAKGSRSFGSHSENLVISEQGAAWSSPGYDIKYTKE